MFRTQSVKTSVSQRLLRTLSTSGSFSYMLGFSYFFGSLIRYIDNMSFHYRHMSAISTLVLYIDIFICWRHASLGICCQLPDSNWPAIQIRPKVCIEEVLYISTCYHRLHLFELYATIIAAFHWFCCNTKAL